MLLAQSLCQIIASLLRNGLTPHLGTLQLYVEPHLHLADTGSLVL